ncbi:MBL fold metallo-hydrolase [Salinicoccus siamensis]|uniref:MBL fold metallo-hydrolase n=1 Tax=Salinicoccus siamensis TaxID=381830 RepID=A0ABV5Z1R5_9STAP
MEIRTLPLGPLETNCYLLCEGEDVLIVDPSGEPEKIREAIGSDLTVKGILLTHAHFDHIGALEDIADYYDAKTWMGRPELEWLADPAKNGSAKYTDMGLPIITADIQPAPLEEGRHSIGKFEFEVLYTPGHSPGSLSYLFNDFIVSGDVLFNGGIGRTDLYQADHSTLIDSIRNKMYMLDDEIVVYPGHGPETTIGYEKKTNPFVRK